MTLLLLAATLLAQSPAPADTTSDCSISGRVSSATTGAPLRKADIRMRSYGGINPVSNQRGPNQPAVLPSATSDGEGNFHLDHVPAGKYALSTTRNGYVDSRETTLQCDAGQTVTDVALKLIPEGMIFGKVLDQDGDPVRGAMVQVMRPAWQNGRKQYFPSQSTNSQADGSFVIGGLAPGHYLMSVQRFVQPAPKGEAFVSTYYPDAIDPSAATQLVMPAGGELRGIQISIRTARVFSVRGKTVDTATGEPGANISLILTSSSGVMTGSTVSAITRPEGSFSFESVLPGKYIVQAMRVVRSTEGRAERSPLVVSTPIVVSNSDIDDLTLTLSPGAEITGTVKMDDVPQSAHIFLTAANGVLWNYSGQAKEGEFAIHGVGPSVYRVDVNNLPDNCYVKSIKFVGREIEHHQIDLSSGAGGILEVQLSSKPALIGGVVSNSNGDPVENAVVQLWPKDDNHIQTFRTRADGLYFFRNLPPGEYRVIAFEEIESGVAENPAFRASFASQGTAVTVQEGGQETAVIKAIGKAAVEAEIAKIQ